MIATKEAVVEGTTVRVGDYVCFKCDIEQTGRIAGISNGVSGIVLILENINGFQGDYIGGDTMTKQMARDCWIDG